MTAKLAKRLFPVSSFYSWFDDAICNTVVYTFSFWSASRNSDTVDEKCMSV